MKNSYSSKQKSIYEEYSLYSSDMLNRMMNDRKGLRGNVIRIIADILAERKQGSCTPVAETPEPAEIKDDGQPVTGEFPEEEGSNAVYEEVPWLTKKAVYFPGITEAIGDYVNGSENAPADETDEEVADEYEINIDEEKEKYWKCQGCSELVEVVFDVCWNCQSERPEVIVHPDAKEVIKEIREERDGIDDSSTSVSK
jgi:hypothetical protein